MAPPTPAGQALHAFQQPLVFAPLGEDLGDVGAFEDAALRAGGEHLGHVLPALVLLERLDLAVQAEEVVGEIRFDAGFGGKRLGDGAARLAAKQTSKLISCFRRFVLS